jgi:hypothetical protein
MTTGENGAKNKSFKILPATEFSVVIPRLLSSMMMHINVEADIRNGLNLMKYAINHPQNFKLTSYEIEWNKECMNTGMTEYKNKIRKVSWLRVLFAFSIGLAQTMIAIIMEFIVIIYLASLKDLMDIIRQFASMSAIVRFDDMYAAAIFENKMLKVVGKKLKFKYKRYMGFEHEQENNGVREIRSTLSERQHLLENENILEDPKKDYVLFQVLRVIHKFLRMYYVCFCYYFVPFISVMVTFLDNMYATKAK